MDQFVQSGQYLSGRYQLTKPYDQQLPHQGTNLWAATDKLLGTEVRVLMLDPQLPVKQAVLDAARRSALVDGARVIRVLSVSDSADSVYVATEVPSGRNVATLLKGTPLRAEQVHAIVGSVAATLGAARQRGLRHLHITPERLWITADNQVCVDGIGMASALSGTQSPDMSSADADRLEVHRLLGFAASLLTGMRMSDPDDVDAVISRALVRHDLPSPLRQALSNEVEGLGASLASTLAKELAPAPSLDPEKLEDPHAARFFPTEQIQAVGAASNADTAPQAIVSYPPAGASPEVSSPEVPVPDPEPSGAEQVGPGADPSKTARFPKITAPLGGAAAAAGTADVAEVASNGAALSSDTKSFDDVISANTPASPAPGLNPTVSAGFAAGLAKAAQTQEVARPEDASGSAEEFDDDPELDPELGIVPPPDPGLAPQWVKPDEFARSMQDETADWAVAAEPVVSPAEAAIEEDELTEETAEPAADVSPEPAAEVAQDSVVEFVPEPPVETSDTDTPSDVAATAQFAVPVPAPPAPPSLEPSPQSAHTPQSVDSPHEASAATFLGAGRGGEGSGRPPRAANSGSSGNSGKRYNPSKVITLGAVILVVLALTWAVATLFRPTTEPNITKPTISAAATTPADSSEPSKSSSAEPKPTPSLAPPTISNVTVLNPQADTADEDSPSTIPNAWDGNPSTSWRSWWYSNVDFAGKEGVGLEIRLAAEANVSDVVLTIGGQGGNVKWFNTSAAAPNGGKLVAESAMGAETVLHASEPLKTSTIILWFNQLPVDGEGNNRIDLAEIQVR